MFFVIELITIDSIFGVCFYIASFDVRNLVIADAYIAATNSGRTVRTKGNLSPCGLVADRSDARQVLSQLQIIRDLAIFIRGFMEQDVLASIDVFFRLFILTFTSWRIAFYSQCCMRSTGFFIDFLVDVLQITKVSCILQSIAGCCSNRSFFTFCILSTIESTLYIGNSCTILTSKSNLALLCIQIILNCVIPQFLQLCHVDGIGIVCTGGYAVDLAGYCAIRSTNGYGTSSCIPGMGSLICRLSLCCGIIATYLFSRSSSYFRPAADGYTALGADFCVVADSYDVGGCRFIVGSIGRTDDDVVLLIRQFVVVAEDDIGLVRIYAVTADLVLRADDIVVLAVGQFILEAIDEVILRRRTFCISAVCARDFVADAGDLCHIGFVNGVAAAHNHDLSTAGRNCILQSIFQLFSVPG